jgi:hypothetical protein
MHTKAHGLCRTVGCLEAGTKHAGLDSQAMGQLAMASGSEQRPASWCMHMSTARVSVLCVCARAFAHARMHVSGVRAWTLQLYGEQKSIVCVFLPSQQE